MRGTILEKMGLSFLKHRQLDKDDGSKSSKAAKAVAKELANEAKNAIGKKIALKIITFTAPILGPIFLIIICVIVILVPTAYGFMIFKGTFKTFAENVLLTTKTNIWLSFEGWFSKEESDRYIEETTVAYNNYLEERFVTLNEDLLKAYSKKEVVDTLGTEDKDDDTIMTPEEANEITAPNGREGYSTHVGLSWFLGNYKGDKIVSHGGSDIGFRSNLVMILEKRIGFVWLIILKVLQD